jgi:type IV pilus assembly protein PilN
MYSLDINFLNDRQERPIDQESRVRYTGQQSSTPLYLGLIAAIFLPAAVLGAWAFLNYQNQQLTTRLTSVDSDLASINQLQAQVTQINEERQEVEATTLALATVFDQIKPWSALLQDIGERTPANIRLSNVEQVDVGSLGTDSATPGAGRGVSGIVVSGVARTFDDVNDMVLLLKQSPYFIANQTNLASARLTNDPTQIEVIQDTQGTVNLEASLPQVVQFEIETQISNVAASELLPELERNLAVGLTARIQALRDKGVLQP